MLLLAGCEASLSPIIHEIRESRPEDRLNSTSTTIEVCYNRLTTTPDMVTQLANEACVKRGGQAKFVRHIMLQCTLVVPVSAIFECR